jgi:hypothetical protein
MSEVDEHWKSAAIALTIVLVFGVLPSFLWEDWVWFSRSGSLLVTYGLYVVWCDIQSDVHEALEKVKETASEKFGGVSTEVMDIATDIQAQNRKLYRTVEFVVIGIGTVIWGYGDLLNTL